MSDRSPIGPYQNCWLTGRSSLSKNVMGTLKILLMPLRPAESLIVKIVDNSSRDEEIDEQLHLKECLGNQSDPSS